MLALVAATRKELLAGLQGLGFGDHNFSCPSQGECVGVSLEQQEILACISGVGLVNAGIMAGSVLQRGVTGVVNIGIAGAYDNNVAPLCSVWLAASETWPEYGLLDEQGISDPRALGFAQACIKGEAIWDRLNLDPDLSLDTLGLGREPCWKTGDFLSVSSVNTSVVKSAALGKRFDVQLENMEGFALAMGCATMGVPFVEIRTVSNIAGSRESADWDIAGAFTALGNACNSLFSGRRGGCPL